MTDYVTPRRMARVRGITPDGEEYDLRYPVKVTRDHPGFLQAPDLFMVVTTQEEDRVDPQPQGDELGEGSFRFAVAGEDGDLEDLDALDDSEVDE